MRVAEPGVVDYMDESSNMDSTQADSASLAGDFPAPSTPATDTPTEKKKKVGSEKKRSSAAAGEHKVQCTVS